MIAPCCGGSSKRTCFNPMLKGKADLTRNGADYTC
jgi:hypothetical protein